MQKIYIYLSYYTQGVGWDQPSVSDWITSVTLVDSSGKLRTFKEGNHTDNEVLSAIKVSFQIKR